VHGVVILDKPRGVSSAAAVDHVKRALGADRAGHGGTLDPIATGVLPICLGCATKLAQYLLADDKAYEADLVLGIETDTLDKTGIVTARARTAAPRPA
jgi:tRNA pseudouridine55 synthase